MLCIFDLISCEVVMSSEHLLDFKKFCQHCSKLKSESFQLPFTSSNPVNYMQLFWRTSVFSLVYSVKNYYLEITLKVFYDLPFVLRGKNVSFQNLVRIYYLVQSQALNCTEHPLKTHQYSVIISTEGIQSPLNFQTHHNTW